jgi:hypothetical protein
MPFHLQQFIASNNSGIQTLQVSSFDHGLFQDFFSGSQYIPRKITDYDSSQGSRNLKMGSSRIYLKSRSAENNTLLLLLLFYFFPPLPPHVLLVDFVFLPPGHGRNVTDF